MLMANQEENIASYGAGVGSFGGGSWAMIILVVVVLWLLFKDGHRDGGHDGPGYPAYGFGGCGPCVQPTFKDESNFEEERNINSKLCCMDKDIWKTDCDVWKSACETQNVEHCEAEKTRALIESNYIQDLRDKLQESQMCNMTLKQEMFTEKKFDQVLGAISKLDCECVKRPPVFAECVTPNTHDIDCNDRRFGFRDGFRDGFGFRDGRRDDCCGCGC